MDDEQILYVIEEYWENNPQWDCDFFFSVKEYYEKTGQMSPKQRKALESIIEKNNMLAKGAEELSDHKAPWE